MNNRLSRRVAASARPARIKAERKIPEAARPATLGIAEDKQLRLADQAYIILEEMIVTLKLAPGSVVSESILSDAVGIGRTPVREALQRLAHDKLVVIHPARGIFISEINVKTQLRLLETRRVLESLIASSAARRATEAERSWFLDTADQMQKSARTNDQLAFLRLDREFNAMAAFAARNEFSEAAIAPLQALSRRFWFMHHKGSAELRIAARQHADIAKAIAAKDEEAAKIASECVVSYLETFTRASLSLES